MAKSAARALALHASTVTTSAAPRIAVEGTAQLGYYRVLRLGPGRPGRFFFSLDTGEVPRRTEHRWIGVLASLLLGGCGPDAGNNSDGGGGNGGGNGDCVDPTGA